MKVLIGTSNPGKIEGAKKAFSKYFDNVDIIGVPVSSDVSDEPVNEEIYTGAENRVLNLKKYANENNIIYDYCIAIESGITNKLGDWCIINIAIIENNEGYKSWGTSPTFPVPPRYVDKIINNTLGNVMDEIFKKHDLRSHKGGISFLTHDEITRIDLTESAFIMALTEFINNDIWK